jgi:transcriptional regulator with XRE-family HTH domain
MKKSEASNPLIHLGKRLRSLRTTRKLTMDQLSGMAGVSKAMLSQIEQDKVNPTVAVMLKIAGALKISVSDLLDVPQPHNIMRIIKGDDETYTFRSDKLCSIRTLSPLSLEKTIEFYLLTLEPNGELDSEAHFPGTEEMLYLAKGKLDIASGNQNSQITKGDSIHYRADLPHTVKNVGRGQAQAYLIVRYREE